MFKIYLAALLEKFFFASSVTEKDFMLEILDSLLENEEFELEELIINYSSPVRFFTPIEFIEKVELLKNKLEILGYSGGFDLKPNSFDHQELPKDFILAVSEGSWVPRDKLFLFFLARIIFEVLTRRVNNVDEFEEKLFSLLPEVIE